MSISHIYVPKQEIATDSELEELLEKYRVTIDQLPLVKVDDVMAKSLEAKPGQVLKITRKNKKNVEETYLRKVVD